MRTTTLDTSDMHTGLKGTLHPGSPAAPLPGRGTRPAKPRRRRKYLLYGGVAAVLAAAVTWLVGHGGSGIQYRTAPVERGRIASTVSATGSLNAVVTVQVGSQVSGNILALYADFNTKVQKGQLVARIDPQLFQARVDQATAALTAARSAVANAEAGVEKAQADVSVSVASVAAAHANTVKNEAAVQNAKANLQRQLTLFQSGIISQTDRDAAQLNYDSAVASLDATKAQEKASQDGVSSSKSIVQTMQAQVASARAQVKQAEASLAQARLDLAHTYITAPVDGVVVARNVDVGQTVAASLQAPTLFQIAQDLTKMQVDTNVSEADVGRARVGQTATFTVDAYPGRTFRGLVTSIRKAPINVQNVVTYDVVVAVSNPDLKLFPGMTANVNILVDQRENALKIPNAALRYRPATAANAGSRKAAGRGHNPASEMVWVPGPDGKPQGVPVTVGLSDGTYSEVTGGNLKEGQQVITAAFSGADTGAKTGGATGGPRGPRGPRF